MILVVSVGRGSIPTYNTFKMMRVVAGGLPILKDYMRLFKKKQGIGQAFGNKGHFGHESNATQVFYCLIVWFNAIPMRYYFP